MDAGAIVGIVIGSIAVLLIIVFLVYWYWWKPHHNRSSVDREESVEFSKRPYTVKFMDGYDQADDDTQQPEFNPEANVAMTEPALSEDENETGEGFDVEAYLKSIGVAENPGATEAEAEQQEQQLEQELTAV